jgi:hypothetical protein
LRRLGLAIVKARTKKPEAPAGSILHHIIIAGCLSRAAPPLCGDALWTAGIGHLMPHAAPTELSWRPFRNESNDVCGFGGWQQQEWTLACR